MPVGTAPSGRALAYYSAQAVVEGQDSWAAVMEVVGPMQAEGWRVDLYRPRYDGIPGALKRVFEILREQLRLARTLKAYDAVYVRAHPLAWPIARYARARRVPVVQESNGSWEDAFVAWPATRRVASLVIALQRDQYRAADGVIAVSEGLARWLSAETDRGDVVVSPNGANHHLFRPGLPKPEGLPECYAVFFGQFAPWQRIEVLLAAAQHAEWPDGVDLVVVGDGLLRPIVERAAGENPHITYLGPLAYADVPPVVANALAAAVLTYAPERAGYSPLKLYESMACGVPVVCSDTPGQAEYVREANAGIVVPPEDAEAVARAVAALAADPEAARGMGENGRRAVEERYSWEARARQRLGVIEAAIERRRVGR